MPKMAFAAPLLPGKTDIDREAMTACWKRQPQGRTRRLA